MFDNNLKNVFRTDGGNNYMVGCFIGLYKKLNLHGNNYFRISSTLFGMRAKLNNLMIFDSAAFNDRMHYNNLYVENAIELNMEYPIANGFNLSIVPALKYNMNLNNKDKITHIALKNSERTINIKNEDEFYMSLLGKVIFGNNTFALGTNLFVDNREIYVKFVRDF